MKSFFLLLIFLCALTAKSQHLYPEKFEGCNTSRFCLDCGDPQAKEPTMFGQEIIDKLDKKTLAGLKGTIEVQILVDENGKPCLLSAENKTGVSLKKIRLLEAINGTSDWQPAVSSGKKSMVSVSLLMEFGNGSFTMKRKIFDSKNEKNVKSVGTPAVDGTDKKNLSKKWTVYTQDNSELPWDMTRAVASDNDGNIWIGTDNGIVEIRDGVWHHYNSKNTIIEATKYDKDKTQSVRYAAVDKNNNKWFIVSWDVYKFDNEKWIKFDSINSPIKWARKIFIDLHNNAWFTSWDGVAKFDGNTWTTYNKSNAGLPTDKVLGMGVDTKNRIWIGTFEGNVMIENGKTSLLDDMDSPLSKAYISNMQEDRKGNLWFSLYNDKSPENEGIFILDTLGKWTEIEFPNQKMLEENSINDFLFDEDNNELWITFNTVGVLYYDLNTKKWEVYTNKNSNVPSVHVEQITKDKKGNVWIATYAGVIETN